MDRPDSEPVSEYGMPQGLSAMALAKVPLALVLTNPHLPDNPIIYVNRAFENLTGYSAAAAIGRNCRFLQGEATDPSHVRRIGEALRAERDLSIDIVNYRSDGVAFTNRLMMTPLHDRDGHLQCFLGVQRDISAEQTVRTKDSKALDAALGEVQHRVKNHLAMIIGMIRMQARARTSADSFNALARRIESLQLLYQEMTEAGVASSSDRSVPLGAYVSRIASTIGHLDGRRSVRVNVDCDAIDVSVEQAARIGLLFSELLTNALKHAFEGRSEGLVEARLKMLSSGVIRLSITDDGVGLPKGSSWPYAGPKPEPLDEAAVREIEASIETEEGPQGEPNIAREIARSLEGGDEAGAGTGTDVVEASAGDPRTRDEDREAKSHLGGRIVVSLVRALDARLNVNSATVGTTVTVDIQPEDAR
ncbi:PAS domain-containing protein [Aurantimonas sp. Leaf443]|uniref:PAS domain-containing protein n=1 Tax=Aurantimonas sp. Leaf443 TaxID=1736378 RepID=UPI0006F564E1|nr:PAS domain-containing protein [Aurantimonas sp. Leaf443]KQT84002.1 histidine kinase [Aurantimonas sp. Leaf443]